jgi:type II secretory pathway pseudopilin PulG
MKQVLKNERGMALAVAIVALVIVGALVAGAFFSGTQEQRVAENARRVQASFGVAEQGVYEMIRTWPDSVIRYQGLGLYPSNAPASTKTLGTTYTWSNTGSFGGTLFKLNNEVFLVDVTGRDAQSLGGNIRGGGASQRVGLLATIRPLNMDIQASLTTTNSDKVSGGSTIDGNDHTPTGWTSCGPLDSAKAGIRADSGSSVTQNGGGTVLGNPPVKIDPTVSDSTFTIYGDVTYSTLAARATITLPGSNFSSSIAPVVTNGNCDLTVQTNWGDPQNPSQPCGTYFPIVHITGSATINGQEGQGILLVDGDLSVQGGFQFYGITIIKGSLKTAGGGGTPAHFWGTVMAQDSVTLGQTNTLSGAANLLYSKCAILKALDATGVGAPMRSRGWVQLF